MRRYWHCDEVSRATGNSNNNKNMWRESEAKDAPSHPRRQLTVMGGGEVVYPKFLEWREYRNFKLEQGEGFKDPGRTLFLSTRCKCLTTVPTRDQRACVIHTQQSLYLEALRREMPALHGSGCKCECRWCKNGCKQWMEVFEHLGTCSEGLACEKVSLPEGDPNDEHGFGGRNPECTSMSCVRCASGGEGGIPSCAAVEQAEKMVEWTRFEEGAKTDGKKYADQKVPVKGRFCDLWAEFTRHSKKYMCRSCDREMAGGPPWALLADV